jgi:hypothetical protein
MAFSTTLVALFAATISGMFDIGACDVVGPVVGFDCHFWICTCTCPFCGLYDCFKDCLSGTCTSNSTPLDRDAYEDLKGSYVVYGPTHEGFDGNPVSGTWVGLGTFRGKGMCKLLPLVVCILAIPQTSPAHSFVCSHPPHDKHRGVRIGWLCLRRYKLLSKLLMQVPHK